jgi:hypothetical protein
MSTLSRKVSLLPGSPTGTRENSGGGESSLNAPAAPAPYSLNLTWRDLSAFFSGFWAGVIVGIAGTLVIVLTALLGLSLT